MNLQIIVFTFDSDKLYSVNICHEDIDFLVNIKTQRVMMSKQTYNTTITIWQSP